MRVRTALLGIAAALGLALPSSAQEETGAEAPPAPGADRVVLLLFEGFAPSLLSAVETPSFDRLREEGNWTHRLHSVFPTQAWVNGASLETGCWPEHHGIIAERFVDPERGPFDREALHGWLLGCEDLGQVAARQGVRVTRFGGFGIEEGGSAERCEDGTRRRDTARRRALLAHLREAPNAERELVLAHFCAPGDTIRRQGVDTPRSVDAVAGIDAFVGEVIAALEGEGPPSALVVATDHGMRDVSHLIQLDRILDREGVAARVEAAGSTALLYLDDPSTADDSAVALSRYAFFEVLQKGALPAYVHWGEGARVPELIVSAYPPYYIEARERWPYWLRPLAWVAPDHLWAEGWRRATSGFVPRTPAMYGLVYAWGAGIEGGGEAQALRVIDLHPTLTHLLGIEPGDPVDGRVANTLLRPAPPLDAAAAHRPLP